MDKTKQAVNFTYFDTHAHLDDKKFDANRAELLAAMKSTGIACASIGVDYASSARAVSLAEENLNVWAVIGQHPLDNRAELWEEEKYTRLLESSQRVVAVGECGLDYYWPKKDLESGKISAGDFAIEKTRQAELFKKQIKFALEHDLPLMLHVRSHTDGDAHWDALQILAGYASQNLRANFHFFYRRSRAGCRNCGARVLYRLSGGNNFC